MLQSSSRFPPTFFIITFTSPCHLHPSVAVRRASFRPASHHFRIRQLPSTYRHFPTSAPPTTKAVESDYTSTPSTPSLASTSASHSSSLSSQPPHAPTTPSAAPLAPSLCSEHSSWRSTRSASGSSRPPILMRPAAAQHAAPSNPPSASDELRAQLSWLAKAAAGTSCLHMLNALNDLCRTRNYVRGVCAWKRPVVKQPSVCRAFDVC